MKKIVYYIKEAKERKRANKLWGRVFGQKVEVGKLAAFCWHCLTDYKLCGTKRSDAITVSPHDRYMKRHVLALSVEKKFFASSVDEENNL